jgi:hypothetical protein
MGRTRRRRPPAGRVPGRGVGHRSHHLTGVHHIGLVDDAEFHFFHFFPYTDLPAGHEKHESWWVDFSNANYDPTVGHQLYNRYLSEMVLADKLGYDGIVLTSTTTPSTR